jgi:putative NADPH-quinone reductase
MNILVILGHPNKGSFNHALADTVVRTVQDNGHQAFFHDLHAERFDPVLSPEEMPKGFAVDPLVRRHCADLSAADGIIIVHPNWWGQPPAILKGWIDRVIRPGVAYEFRESDSGEGVPCGLLKAGTALVFNTSNTPEDREREVFGDPLERIWKKCIFGLCGITNVHRKTFGVIVTSTPERREQWLLEAREIVNRHFPCEKSRGDGGLLA